MAEGDRQLAFTTGSVPTSVQVSGPDRLTPKAVNATFDGYGAGATFLPCLIITGPTGLEVARIPAPEIAAGASAEVSWFPRVASAGGGGGGGGGVEYFHDPISQIVPRVPVWTRLPWTHQSGGNLLDLSNPLAPTFIAAGIYAVTACARVQSSFGWPGSLNLWLSFAGEFEDRASITTASADTYESGTGHAPQVTVTEIRTVTSGETLEALASHNRQAFLGPVEINLTHAAVQQLG